MEANNQKKAENYLLFVPSLVTRIDEIKYTVASEGSESTEYTGVQTNEAVTKYLIDLLEKNKEKIDKVIMLCTPEVINEKKEIIGNQTTFEYYCQKIKLYWADRSGDEGFQTSFIPINYSPQNNEDSNKILSPLQEIIGTTSDRLEDAVPKKVYVDFTGGIRSAALTLVFVCRILQIYGIQVEKILYSNLIPGTKKGIIEECTKTYRLFDYLAAQLEQEYGGTKRMAAYMENELEGKDKEMIRRILNSQNMVRQAKSANQMDKVVEKAREVETEINEAAPELSTLGKIMVTGIQKESKDIVKNEGNTKLYLLEEKLEKEQYADALNLFRETIVSILLENKIIDASNWLLKDKLYGCITNEILGAYSYYSDTVSGKVTFLKVVKEYLKRLYDNQDLTPEECRKKYYGQQFNDIKTYLNCVPNWKFAHSKYSEKERDKFLCPYFEQYAGEETDKTTQLKDKMDRIYMGHGYPFACTYDKYYLSNYDKIYKNIFNRGVASLTRYYNGKKLPFGEDSYEEMIQKLCDGKHNDWIRVLFPFKLNKDNIFPHESREIFQEQEKWDEFIYHFADVFYRVKNVRNKVIHPTNLNEGELEAAAESIKSMIDDIKEIIAQ